jgi:hypothetical protein
MVNSAKSQKLCANYLTEEDLAETEEYFQQAIVIGSTIRETKPQPQTIKHNIQTKVNFNEQFDRLILEAIDEALSSLGEIVKNAVFEHLKDDFGLDKSEIPEKMRDFSQIIHKIFGLGAGRLELRIIKNLNSKLQGVAEKAEMDLPLSEWTVNDILFTDYIENLRLMFTRFE